MNLCNLVDQYIEVRNKIDLLSKHIKDKKPVDMKFYFNFQKLADEFDSLYLQIRYESRKEEPMYAYRELTRARRRKRLLPLECEIMDFIKNEGK